MKTKTKVTMKYIYDFFLLGIALSCFVGVYAINSQLI